MVSKTTKPLKDRVKEVMKVRNVNVLDLSRETGIPSPRIYKWYQSNTNPKADDAEVLELWLKGEKLDKDINEKPLHEEGELSSDSRLALERTLENLSQDKILSTKIIDRLVTILEVNLGIPTPTYQVPDQKDTISHPPAKKERVPLGRRTK